MHGTDYHYFLLLSYPNSFSVDPGLVTHIPQSQTWKSTSPLSLGFWFCIPSSCKPYVVFGTPSMLSQSSAWLEIDETRDALITFGTAQLYSAFVICI
ncbi:hypothetical protein RchiOBHm_Chr1g0363391 [Rosa chinensis]|uniref:Uncharacterized protein n=1 Tax=Rosa chinensis TaxID=74649 RepID=A0A2P6SJG1_ROSCH|nr:hypothetical protein RchiOBHm_Chr1g0363391 [Rosa chinensis]